MKVVVIDGGIGNISSIINMLKRVGVQAIYSRSVDDIYQADKLILPGVGAFDHGMQSLQDANLIDVLNEAVLTLKKPILGICLGMQILLEGSQEGKLPGLGWIKGRCERFRFENPALKVPHMGWNLVRSAQKNQFLTDHIDPETRFYFVHSYHAICENKTDVIGTAYYGYEFPAMIGRDHIWGVQFHPEKSHKYGMQLLKHFIEFEH